MNDFVTDPALTPPPALPQYNEPPPPPVESVQPQTLNILRQIRAAVEQVFIGQTEVIHQVMAALLAGGHVLLEGKPGLGKTHLVQAIGNSVIGNFPSLSGDCILYYKFAMPKSEDKKLQVSKLPVRQ